MTACSGLDSDSYTYRDNQILEKAHDQPTATSLSSMGSNQSSPQTTVQPTQQLTPTSTSTPDSFSSLYDCEMEINFLSGPLEGETTSFLVLGTDYFYDKGDKFTPGKGTAVYYEEVHYFILHSSYANGNIFQPMEGELLRIFLEYWGMPGNDYIQGQIDKLIDSEVVWVCNGDPVFTTTIRGAVKLSHEASTRLWLEPKNLDNILIDREGIQDEWVGDVDLYSESNIYIGFCGWGPDNLGDAKFTYYRYLIEFDVLD